MRIAKILATTGIIRRTKMAGLLSMLGKAGQAAKGISPKAMAGGAVAGGLIAGGTMAANKQQKIREYQGLRQFIKDQTGGLGGLVYSEEKDEYVVTYAGSMKEAANQDHVRWLREIIKQGNDRLSVKLRDNVAFMSDKKSKEMDKAIRGSLKTEEGAERLESYLDKQMSDPYAEDYGEPRKDAFGFGTER